MKLSRFSSALAFGLALGLTGPLQAQTATPAPADDTELVELDTFVVSADTDNGYIAVDSLAGGRSNTPIKLTPSAMSSLTRNFIDDVGIQNVRDALKWSLNVVPSDLYAGKQLANPFNNWDFNFRGAGQSLQGGAGPTRNYFTFYQSADSYNIERIEFDRGPNSILFGVGSVGGVLSTYTKVPRFDRDFITATMTFDSNAAIRAEFDVNRQLTEKFAVRFNALIDRNRGWRENDKNDKQAADLALIYKFNDRTAVRVELEYSTAENTLISTTYADKVSGWDGVTASQTWRAAPTGGGTFQPMANTGAWGDWLNPFNVWIPGLAAKGIMGWAGGYSSRTGQVEDWAALNVAPYAGWYPAQIKLPWHSTYASTAKVPVLAGRDFTYGSGISKPKFDNITAYLTHKFSDHLEAELSAYRYSDTHTAKDYEGSGGVGIDINKQLPDGSANPNFGKPFADFFLSKQSQDRTVEEVRAQLNYQFDATLFGSPWKQRFSVSAGSQEITWSARQYLGQIKTTLASPGDWTQNMIWGRLYFDNPNQVMNIPDTVGNKAVFYGPKADGFWFDFDETYKLNNLAAMSHSRFFNDRLAVLLGVRRDSYDHHNERLRDGPGLSTKIIDDDASGSTYSAGAIYYFNWLGVFANFSKNFDPIGPGKSPGLDGKAFGPATGKGYDYGVRISTDDGKYYATLSHYDTKSSGRITSTKLGFGGIWSNYYQALGLPPDTSKTTLSFDDTEALKVSGSEFEITANPTKNLRLQASYGRPDAEIIEAMAGQRAYYNTNLALWNTAANVTSGPGVPFSANLKSDLANALNTLNQNVAGKVKVGLVDYTSNFFALYTFRGDLLKGFSAGGGVAYTGRKYVGNLDEGTVSVPYYTTEEQSTTAVFAYETKFGTIPARFALNIDNVLDDQDPIITSYHWGYAGNDGKHIAEGYILPAPRTFRLTARFTF